MTTDQQPVDPHKEALRLRAEKIIAELPGRLGDDVRAYIALEHGRVIPRVVQCGICEGTGKVTVFCGACNGRGQQHRFDDESDPG